MTTQYGAPLTGEQMRLLRAAGLPDGTTLQFMGWDIYADDCQFDDGKSYCLLADHIAYTLIEAGWLDGRNVALWFGGDKAPDDWDGGPVLLADGTVFDHVGGSLWAKDVIAYTRKAEIEYPPANEKLKEAVRLSREMTAQPETVTIAKMTPSEVKAKFDKGVQPLVVLHCLGLIKPEPTRLERFWAPAILKMFTDRLAKPFN